MLPAVHGGVRYTLPLHRPRPELCRWPGGPLGHTAVRPRRQPAGDVWRILGFHSQWQNHLIDLGDSESGPSEEFARPLCVGQNMPVTSIVGCYVVPDCTVAHCAALGPIVGATGLSLDSFNCVLFVQIAFFFSWVERTSSVWQVPSSSKQRYSVFTPSNGIHFKHLSCKHCRIKLLYVIGQSLKS